MRGNQAIVLDLSCGNLTKAISAEDLNSVEAEGYVKHVDVLIFGEQVQQSGQSDAATVFHQRIQWSEAFFVDGTATLNAKRNQFVANQDYKVYVIANSTYPSTAFAAIDEESDLYQLVQTDANLHLTGLASSDESTDEDTTPDFFLMEGRAYTSGTSAVLNDGNAAHSTVLEAGLARAVSKVVVELTAGAKVQFSDPAQSVYHYRNLPYSTVTVPETGYEISPALKSTDAQPINGYVQWQKSVAAAEGVEAVTGKITVTGYVYSYSWTALDKETSLIVNIPMTHIEGGTTNTYSSNYYKIPLSKDRKFERNHYYKVSAVVNAPGSESNFDPITLEDLRYDTFPWVEILPPIEVGNETNKPKYLQLNTYHVDMYNINVDATTLEFSSSSYIPANTTSSTVPTSGGIRLVEAYYYNKYSQKTPLNSTIQATISSTAEQGVLNGKITITSPIVPKTQAEINAEIKALGPEPTPPQLPTEPSEPAGKPEEPTVVTEPSVPVEPDPDDYVKNNTNTAEYKFENNQFYKRTRTLHIIVYGDWSDWSIDTETQAEYDAAYAEYVSKQSTYDADLEAYNTYVNVTLPAYQAELAEWQQSAEGQAYLQQKAEYDAAMTVYNSQYAAYETALQEYNQKVADIEASAEGEETHYNTVRYLTFEVYNEQGMSATFTVAQYPVIYITNVVGWYSYRDDFKTNSDTPTTYLTKGDGIVGISYNENYKSYSYNTSSSGFWYSKVNTNVSSSGTVDNTLSDYTIRAYNWSGNSVSTTNPVGFGTNTRMYHIEVTSTSKNYIVGRPRMVDPNGNTTTDVENSITADDAANARLVSPSFMTASRLGALNSGSLDLSDLSQADALAVCKEHCKNYVEVVADGKGTVYSDWRLPTAAEIGIIVSLQGSGSGDNTTAIDYLLNANYYYSASGPVANDKVGSGLSGTASVRCIRDVY